MDVELAEIRDFLAANPPYDQLPANLLNELPKQLTARYFRRGSVIIELGQPNEYVHVLRSGAVDIIDAHGSLADRDDPGSSFGLSSVLTGGPSLYRIVAHEDSLCLLLPASVFHRLAAASEAFSQFFLRQHAGRLKASVQAVGVKDSGSAIMRTRVRDIIKRSPITIPPSTTIREAAQVMTDSGGISALLVVVDERLVGILTDRDMRSKVVAAGLSSAEPVTAIMTADPLTIPADRLAFEVMVEMTQYGFHHLPVVEEGQLLGMITSGDLMRLEQANPTYLIGEIQQQTALSAVVATTARLPQVVEAAVVQDATADDIARVVTAVADAVTRKLLNLAEADLGEPPVRYCWVALGSQGRMETGLQSDQDNAIIIDDAVTPEQLEYFARLADQVVDGMEACGYDRCPGDMMASNPTWRVPLRTWGQYFARWMNEPEPEAVLNAQTFFDMRPIYGDKNLYERLHSAVLARAPRASRFLAYMARDAQRFEPPLGFFRDFVLEDSGAHRNTLDVKVGGIAPIIQIARIFALSRGQTQLNTIDRLKGAASSGALSAENSADLADAFEFITHVRVRHQVEQISRGEKPDNHVPPAVLSPFERRQLKEAFAVVRRMQGALAFVHRTDMTS